MPQPDCSVATSIWLAVEGSKLAPSDTPVAVQVVRMTGPSYTSGITTHLVGQVPVRIYDPAKTVADCFKFRSRVGLDVAVEALRDCLAQRRATHRSTFMLKGAFLFYPWQHEVGHPTRDLDLLGHGTPDIRRLEGVIADIAAVELAYPTLLDQDAPRILTYRPEFVVAEKLEAMVALGDINTRLKDYYDLWRVNRTMALPREDLIEALRATFARRGTAIPTEIPPGLADEFADDSRTRIWEAFIARNELDAGGVSLVDVV